MIQIFLRFWQWIALLLAAHTMFCPSNLNDKKATANVDSRTDALLQEAVQKSFDGATILAVAHRLDTVIEYDKILVLGGGEVVAFDTPHKLSLEENGVFASMIEDTGKGMASELRRRASRVSLVDLGDANGKKG